MIGELAALLSRLERAKAEVLRESAEASTCEVEYVELAGKREGIALAIGYVEDAIRGVA